MSWRLGSWLVVAAVGFALFDWMGIPLLDPDEARFARTSVEMLRGGDYVVPSFEGQPRLVKPPLVHWIQAALFSLLGAGSWVARLHAWVGAVGLIVLVAAVARQRFGDEAGVWAAAVLGTMPLVLAVGRVGTLDALLGLHVFAALALDLDRGPADAPDDDVEAGADAPGGRELLIGAVLGLAFLIKGPVGVAAPLIMMLAGRTVSGRRLLPSLTAALRGLAVWCGVVLPWGVAFLSRVGAGSAAETVRAEALERYFAGTSHIKPFWYYVPVLLVAVLPWGLALGFALGRALLRWRDPASPNGTYLGGAFVAGLVFFSLSRGKLPSYIVPLLPLAALLLTWQLGRELEAPWRTPWAGRLIAVSLAGLSVLFAAVGLGALDIAAGYRGLAGFGAAAYAVGALVALVGLRQGRPRRVWGAAAAAAAIFMFGAMLVLVPNLARTRTAGYLVEAVPELQAAPEVLVVDMKVPSLTFYLDRVPLQVDMAHLEESLRRQREGLFVFDEADLSNVEPGLLGWLAELGQAGKYRVFRNTCCGGAEPLNVP